MHRLVVLPVLLLLAGCAGVPLRRAGAPAGLLPTAPASRVADEAGGESSPRNAFVLQGGVADFDEVEDTVTMLGAELVLGLGENVSAEVGLLDGNNDGKQNNVPLEVDVTHVYLGARFHGDPGEKAQPYFSLGLERSDAEIDTFLGGFRVTDDDSTTGGYARLGVLFDIGDGAFFGIEARAGGLGATYDLLGGEEDADYVQGTASFGFRF